MKNLLTVSLALVLGCGAEIQQQGLKPEVSIQGMKDYFVSRNVSGQDLQNFENNIANKVDRKGVQSKEKVLAANENGQEFFADRNITSGDMVKGREIAQDKVDRKLRVIKTNGADRLQQVRNPDEDERQAIKELNKRLEETDNNAQELEARIVLEEAMSTAQAILISQMQIESRLQDDVLRGEISDHGDQVEDSLEQVSLTISDMLEEISNLENALAEVEEGQCQVVRVRRVRALVRRRHGNHFHHDFRLLRIPVIRCGEQER